LLYYRDESCVFVVFVPLQPVLLSSGEAGYVSTEQEIIILPCTV
jgi:hypothetical protein